MHGKSIIFFTQFQTKKVQNEFTKFQKASKDLQITLRAWIGFKEKAFKSFRKLQKASESF